MRHKSCGEHPEIRDYGCAPFVFNIHHATNQNENFRTTLWTGRDLQLTLMSIPICGDIGAEMHDDLDQFIKVESGCANVYMGRTKQSLKLVGKVNSDYAIVIPAGVWHNVVNACSCPLKAYSVYAPPKHPIGTVHATKLDSDVAGD